MNTLKIECSKNDYIIRTCTVNSENEIMVEIPQNWNCDYVNAVLWEDDICEVLEKGDERMLLNFSIRNDEMIIILISYC